MPDTSFIRLLGPPDIRRGESPVSLGVKHVAIIVRLAAEAPARVSRAELARQLWSTKPDPAARHNLSQALYHLRKELGPDTVNGDDRHLWLGEVTSDLSTFREALAHGDIETAAATYQGAFAASFGVPGQVGFEQWLDVEREATRRQAMSLLQEPLPDGLRNDLAKAIWGAEGPSADMDAPAHDSEQEKVEYSFVGRSDYFETLAQLWHEALGRSSQVAIVEGEAGIGKSALCSRFFKKTVLRGASGVQASGYELEQHLPYGVIVQILTEMDDSGWLESVERPWIDILRRVYPSLTRSDEPPAKVPPAPAHRLALALSRVVASRAELGPVSIFVDDIQWADPISIGILHYIHRASSDLPLFFLFARRTDAASKQPEISWTDAVVIQLRGLSRVDTEYLVKCNSKGIAEPADVDRIQRLSQGNPLLIRALIQAGLDAPTDCLPPTVFRYFQAQVEQLPSHAKTVGAALAAVGGPLATPDLLSITHLSEADANAALQDLWDGGFVRLKPREGQFAFHHDLVAEVFLSAVPPATRAALHGRAGRLLVGQGRSPAVVAMQFAIAGTHSEAFQTAMKAATASAELHAYKEAEHFFRIATTHADTPTEEAEAKSDLAELLILQNRAAEAEDLLSELIQKSGLEAEEMASVQLRHFIASLKSTVRTGDYLTEVLECTLSTEDHVSPLLTMRTYTGLTANALEAGRSDIARRALVQANRILHTLEDGPQKTSQEVTALALAALLEPHGDSIREVEALLSRVEHSPAAQVHGLLARGVISFMQGHMNSAEADFVRSIGICEKYGLFDQGLAVASNLGVCYMEQGRWDEAEAQFSIALKAAEIAPRRELQSTLWNMAILEYERARYERAIDFGKQCLDFGQGRSSEKAQIGGLAIIGLAQLELGRLSEARSCERQIQFLLRDGIRWSNDISYIQIFLARMSAIGGDRTRAVDELSEYTKDSLHFDYYCAARIKVEYLRLLASGDSKQVLLEAKQLRPELAKAKAVPLVERIDRLIVKSSREQAGKTRCQ